MSDHSADYVALNVEPFEGPCDCCAEGDKRIVHVDEDTSAYLCEDCIALEEQAIQAGADAWREAMGRPEYTEMTVNELARVIVNGYVNAKFQAEQFDGTGCAK